MSCIIYMETGGVATLILYIVML